MRSFYAAKHGNIEGLDSLSEAYSASKKKPLNEGLLKKHLNHGHKFAAIHDDKPPVPLFDQVVAVAPMVGVRIKVGLPVTIF